MLLFGGVNSERNVWFADTWLYASGSWQNLTATAGASPPPLAGYGLAYDASDGYDVLFGGFVSNGSVIAQTWAFGNGRWTQLRPALTPPARAAFGMVYDVIDGYVVVFGGVSGATTLRDDTWAFKGGNWTQLTPSVSPSPRSQFAMNYDPADQEAILEGGWNGGTSYLGDSWAFRGGAWFPVPWIPSVGARGSEDQSAVDPYGSSYILFGGYNGILLADTWTFSGNLWNQEARSTVPAARADAAMALDESAGYVLLFGGKGVGSGPGGAMSMSDTWIWEAPQVTVRSTTSVIDVGQSIRFSASWTSPASVGSASWSWGGTSLACFSTSGPTETCTPAAPGNYSITFRVTDFAGAWSNVTERFQAHERLTGGLASSPAVAYAGEWISFNLSVAGGTPPIAFSFTGLPSVCGTPLTEQFGCTLNSAQTFVVTAHLQDSAGETVQARAGVVVDPALAIISFATSPTSAAVGQAVTLRVVASGGVAPIAYRYLDLPPGCSSADVSELVCSSNASGTYSASVSVSDSAGELLVARVTWTVGGTGSAGAPTWIIFLGIAALIAASAGATSYLLLRRRRTRRTGPNEASPPL